MIEGTDSHEDLDQSSERWLESCFNDNEMHASSDQMYDHLKGLFGYLISDMTQVLNYLYF